MVLLLGRFVAAAHTGRCRMCKIWDIVLGGILIMAAFTQIVEQASDILWNYLLLFLLVGTGIFFTIKLHFVQLSSFADGVRHLFKGFSLHGKAADKDGMSSFQALATAIAAQVGTGNITGCATALVSGGPRLVENGAICTTLEPGFQEARFTSAVTSRTALGKLADGKLVIVSTGSASIQQLRELMLQLGCVEAVNLDGGGSTALAYQGKLIRSPGRELTTTLQIFAH